MGRSDSPNIHVSLRPIMAMGTVRYRWLCLFFSFSSLVRFLRFVFSVFRYIVIVYLVSFLLDFFRFSHFLDFSIFVDQR